MADTPVELAKDVIVNYKDITSWGLLLTSILIGYINYRKDVSLAKKIESFKAELNKNEIKFTRHTELQIESLKQMYDLVVSFHFSFTNFSRPQYKTHDSLQKNIRTLQASFIKTMTFSNRSKILITDEIIEQVKIVNDKFNRIEELLVEEINSLLEVEEHNGSNDPQYIYGTPENEVGSIDKRIKKLNENVDVQTFEADILKLRKEIENYFKTLVS